MTPIPINELLDLEVAKASDPDYFPMRGPQRIMEYWEYWTPARLEQWREVGR